jgi:adenosylcobinamide-GDP ribazoletransferase
MNKKMLLLSFILTASVGFLVFNTLGIIGIIAGLLSGVLIALVARKNFKWATGDVLGTSNEVARMFSLLIMVSLAFLI